jgi:hypothetical protein
MEALTRSECQAWCEKRGLQVRGRAILGSRRSCVLRVPEKAHRLLSFVCDLFPNTKRFSGGLFWVVDTGALSDDIIDIGLTIQTLMRKGSGLDPVGDAPISEAAGCLFEENEQSQAGAFLVQLLLFSWGGYFVPDHAEYFYLINPDGVLEVVSDDQQWIDIFSALPEKIGMRQDGNWIA